MNILILRRTELLKSWRLFQHIIIKSNSSFFNSKSIDQMRNIFRAETELERQFSNHLARNTKKNMFLLQFCMFIFFTFRCISNWKKGSHLIVPITCLVLTILLPVFFATILKPRIRDKPMTKKQMIWEFFFQSFIAILFTAAFDMTYLTNYYVAAGFPYYFFVSGLDWVWILEVFRAIFPRRQKFQLFMPCVIIPTVVVGWLPHENPPFSTDIWPKIELTIRGVILIFNTTILNCVNNRDIRDLFYVKANLEDKEILYREILDQTPESIIILGPNLESKYYNNCFKETIGGNNLSDETLLLKSFFDRITDVHELDTELRKSFSNVSLKRKTTLETLDEFQHTSSIVVHAKEQRDTPERGGSSSSSQVYRGVLRMEGDRSEAVEMKLTKILFNRQPATLVIIRLAPEFELVEKLEKSSKYKDEVLASVSHELRTPINSCINLVSEALRSQDVPTTIKENLLDPAYKSGKLLLNIINDILDFSQIKENKLRLVSQVCSLQTILWDCKHLFDQQCKQKGITFEVEIDKLIPNKIRTDPNRLTQVILNLLSNSYKFTFGGKITIKAVLVSGGLIQISVTDTGIGIKEEDMKKLMKKFEKIDLGEKAASNSTGAGLGLSIANSLAIMLGPKSSSKSGLKFKSQPGVGTSASFLLKSRKTFNVERLRSNTPCSSQDEENSSEYIEEDKGELNHLTDSFEIQLQNVTEKTPKRKSPRRRGDRKPARIENFQTEFSITHTLEKNECQCSPVLIVDDDCFNVLTLATMLKSLGVSHGTAYSGIECLEKFKTAAKCSPSCQKFRLVLMDGNMPLKDGFQTTRELMDWNEHLDDPWEIYCIGCTAYTGGEKWQEFKDAGAVENITKPLSKDDLARLVKKYSIL